MSRHRPWLILATATLLAVALTILVLAEHRARQQGTEVALRVQQFDPRSLLSGHYSRLDFVEVMPPEFDCAAAMAGVERQPDGKAGRWIALRPVGDHYSFAGLGVTRKQAARHGPVQVRGDAFCDRGGDLPQVRLDIGLERYHASQKEAEALDALVRDPESHRVFALVSAGKDGRARLAGVRVDGRDTRLDWFSR